MVDSVTKKIPTFTSRRALIDIEFQDLNYAVPQGRKGKKLILRGISGQFPSGKLTAILGPSGSGKSTLLNILAGYKCHNATGTILINGEPRDLRQFRKMSRYIMQEDLIQPLMTVEETMRVAADLKLHCNLSITFKLNAIDEILNMLHLDHTKHTKTECLSGGEKKRLTIALELLNNPQIIFLDEPTTGLDDMSCSQCIGLLKLLAENGKTVICSIHTPSARLFSIFDQTYYISNGSCVYQGYGPDIISYLSNLQLNCPTHYNPADFMIEVCCGEYGNYHERMVSTIENGRKNFNKKLPNQIGHESNKKFESMSMDDEIDVFLKKNSRWTQFCVLLKRMWLQMWRDKNYLLLKIILHITMGLLIGNLYINIGQDGAKTIFNFGFYFTCIIFFMYVPMMPILAQFPTEVQHIKREHFNKWYNLSSYFCAMTVASIPIQILLGTFYLTMVIIFTDQPIEMERIIPFYFICFLTSIISESFGLLISSTLNIVNGMFVGPVMTVPFMLLAVYGFGSGYNSIPLLIKIAMHFSYLRYSFEGLVLIMLKNREKLACPADEDFCLFTDLNGFIKVMGMDNGILWLDILVLCLFLIIIRGASYYLLRQRLTPNKAFVALQVIGRFVKNQLGH